MSHPQPDPLHRFDAILDEIRPVIAGMDPDAFAEAVAMLDAAPRVFLAGAGRSGLLMKMFAMRLMQAGCMAAVAGESTTPSIQRGDLLVIASGSGNTATMRALAETADRVGAALLLLTYAPDSSLAGKADHVLYLPVPLVDKGDAEAEGRDGVVSGEEGFGGRDKPGTIRSSQILGTLFDQAVQFVSTLLVEGVARRRGETNLTMQARHANLE